MALRHRCLGDLDILSARAGCIVGQIEAEDLTHHTNGGLSATGFWRYANEKSQARNPDFRG
jgi:hypothetical protein